jgi:hypothetical protein
MVFIQHDDECRFISHNGRHYNIILIHEKDRNMFRLTTPFLSFEWDLNDPIPDEVEDIFSKAEIRKVQKFIGECV